MTTTATAATTTTATTTTATNITLPAFPLDHTADKKDVVNTGDSAIATGAVNDSAAEDVVEAETGSSKRRKRRKRNLTRKAEEDADMSPSLFDSLLLPSASGFWDGEEFESVALGEWSATAEEVGEIEEEGEGQGMTSKSNGRELLKKALASDDLKQRADLLHQAADLGDANAQCKLGVAYRLGKGVEQDIASAVLWFGYAAVQGHKFGQYCLGLCYLHGQGVNRDHKEALSWFEKAATRQHVLACVEAAKLSQSLGLLDKALKLWRTAAEAGSVVAQTQLGALLEKVGEPAQAISWYQRAVRQRDPEAQMRLGLCFHYGKGTLVNLKEALRLYQLSASAGYTLAQYCLGRCYRLGRGVPRDAEEGLKWWTQAAEGG